MPNLTQKEKCDRDTRYLDYIEKGMTIGEIALAEGTSSNEVSRKGKMIAKAHQKEWKPPRPVPIILSKETPIHRFRYNLGLKLKDLIEIHGKGDSEDGVAKRKVQRIVGMNNGELNKAKSQPFTHDWTITEIEKLYAAHNMTLFDGLREAMLPPKGGFITQ